MKLQSLLRVTPLSLHVSLLYRYCGRVGQNKQQTDDEANPLGRTSGGAKNDVCPGDLPVGFGYFLFKLWPTGVGGKGQEVNKIIRIPSVGTMNIGDMQGWFYLILLCKHQ